MPLADRKDDGGAVGCATTGSRELHRLGIPRLIRRYRRRRCNAGRRLTVFMTLAIHIVVKRPGNRPLRSFGSGEAKRERADR
jgi:hypothetical protein